MFHRPISYLRKVPEKKKDDAAGPKSTYTNINRLITWRVEQSDPLSLTYNTDQTSRKKKKQQSKPATTGITFCSEEITLSPCTILCLEVATWKTWHTYHYLSLLMNLQSNYKVSGIESYKSTVLPIAPTSYCAVKQNKNDVVESNH